MSRIVAQKTEFDASSAGCASNGIRRACAFTLIELLVLISIILILIAILLPASTAVLRAAEASRMQASLAGLRGAAEEYRAATGGIVDHTVNRFPSAPAVNVEAADDPDNNTIALFVFEAGKVPSVASILVATGRDRLQEQVPPASTPTTMADPSTVADPSHIVFLDIFGNPIRYAGFVNKDDSFTDDDYLPGHPNPFFASAGPDGLWGTVNRSGEPDEDAEDNLYSFDDL